MAKRQERLRAAKEDRRAREMMEQARALEARAADERAVEAALAHRAEFLCRVAVATWRRVAWVRRGALGEAPIDSVLGFAVETLEEAAEDAAGQAVSGDVRRGSGGSRFWCRRLCGR